MTVARFAVNGSRMSETDAVAFAARLEQRARAVETLLRALLDDRALDGEVARPATLPAASLRRSNVCTAIR